MKKVCIIAGVIVGLILMAKLLLPELAWDGAVNVQFQFHLVDSSSGSAVRDANIRVISDDHLHFLSDTNFAEMLPPAVITDNSGRSAVSVLCGAGGSKGLFGKSGSFGVSRQLLLVEAAGYQSISTSLANVVGGRSWPLSKRRFDVELLMLRNQ